MKILNKLPYIIIIILSVWIMIMQDILYFKVSDSAVTLGINKATGDKYANETVAQTLDRGDKLLKETEWIEVDAKKRGWLD